ncbi:prolipoprotein diacylglyceryl transferase [Nanoarchaeota archaeon]
MFTHNIDPVLLNLGFLEIRYYGLVYVLGLLFAYWILYKLAEKKSLPGLTKKLADDLILWVMLGVVVGGRLGYFLFYNTPVFWHDPLEVLMVWHGGMSFHGSLIGVIAAVWWFARKHKIVFYKLTDAIVLPAIIFLGFGRIANFINGEIVGRVADVSWCVDFPTYDGCRHPTQIYLALKNFAVAGVLYIMSKKELPPGTLSWSFIVLYAIGRFLIDFTRLEVRYLGLSMGQYLTLAMVVVGVVMLGKIIKEKR